MSIEKHSFVRPYLFSIWGCGAIGSTIVSTGRGPIPFNSTKQKKVKGSRIKVGGERPENQGIAQATSDFES
jgi:hypothetical protein